MRSHILRPIRNAYLTLHLHTDSAPTAFSFYTDDEDNVLRLPSTYPLCSIPGHHPDSTPRINDISTSMAIPHTAMHDNVMPVPPSLARTPDAQCPPLTSPVHGVENVVPLLDTILAHSPSSHAHQIVTEIFHDSVTSPDPAPAADSANTRLGDITSARTMPLTTRETSTSNPSVPQFSTLSLQNDTDLLAHSGAPEIPPLASPEPMLHDITCQSR